MELPTVKEAKKRYCPLRGLGVQDEAKEIIAGRERVALRKV